MPQPSALTKIIITTAATSFAGVMGVITYDMRREERDLRKRMRAQRRLLTNEAYR
jgi:hypothetical protein